MCEWFIPVIWHNGQLWSEHGFESEKEMRQENAESNAPLLGYFKVGQTISWRKVAAEIPSKHDWYFVLQYDKDIKHHTDFNGNEDWFYSTFLPDNHEDDYECVIVGAGGNHSAVVSTRSMWREAHADGAYESYERHY